MLPDLDSLPLAKLVAQMIVVRASGFLYDHQIQYPQWEPTAEVLQTWIQDWEVGGVILLGGSAPEVSLRSQQLQAWSSVPLLIAADVEEGVGQRFSGATWFPPPMALQSLEPEYAAEMGRITAAEALAIGINWLFAPVVDVNSNPSNPVINVRAFGESPNEVIGLTQAFIRGARQYPVLTTAKHFPGHGDTAIDSHLETPRLDHNRDRFYEVELPPFAAAIAAGVDSIMTAHVFVPVFDAQNIATMSEQILMDLLRQEMQFNGLIVTDALIMGGIANRYTPSQVARQVIEAGADILLMPVDPVETITAICQAVESGVISRDRIKASVTKIWEAKSRVCKLAQNSAASNLFPQVGKPESLAIASEIATKSIRIHQPIPMQWVQENLPTNLILVDSILTCSEFLSQNAPAITLPKQQGCPLLILDAHSLLYLQSDRLKKVFIQVFSRGNPFRGSAGLNQQIEFLVKQLVAEDKLAAIAIYGSPYNLDQLIPLLPPNLPWIFSYSQQPAAQHAVMQSLINDLPHPTV